MDYVNIIKEMKVFSERNPKILEQALLNMVQFFRIVALKQRGNHVRYNLFAQIKQLKTDNGFNPLESNGGSR